VPREAALGPEGFAELFPVSRETLSRLEAYTHLLIRWSARINLVGRDTLPDLWRRHILDSAQLRRMIPDSAQNLIDLGSGAGFPVLSWPSSAFPASSSLRRIHEDPRFCARRHASPMPR